ncbi:MAG: hypothetical protein IKP79_01505 [Bacilli bacterium]|nr:hypothetical protein [Bacilli bacterium]
MKRIKNLYLADVYNRCWFEDEDKAIGMMGDYIASGKIIISKLKKSYVYKTNDNMYIVADEMIKKPFASARLYFSSLNKSNKIKSIKLTDVSKPTQEFGHDGTLGDFIDSNSLKKII